MDFFKDLKSNSTNPLTSFPKINVKTSIEIAHLLNQQIENEMKLMNQTNTNTENVKDQLKEEREEKTEPELEIKMIHENKIMKSRYKDEEEKELNISPINEDENRSSEKIITNFDSQILNQENNEVNELWKKYIKEAKENLEKKIENKIQDKEIEQELNQNKFLRNIINEKDNEKAQNLKSIEKLSGLNLSSFQANDILFSLVIRDFQIYKLTFSDYELKAYFAENYNKFKENPSYENTLSLIKVYFYSSHFDLAIILCNKLIEDKAKSNSEPFRWKGLINLLIYKMSKREEEKKKLITIAENLFISCIKLHDSKIIDLWALLFISLQLKKKFKKYKIQPLNAPEKYAIEISKMDKYLGYIAWIEIYIDLNIKGKSQIIHPLLEEVIVMDSTKPEAYMKLYKFFFHLKKFQLCQEIAERVFIFGTQIDNPQIRYAIILLYSKILIKTNNVIVGIELIQNQYIINPQMPILLYQYAWLIYRSHLSSYYGSAISALEEASRSCIQERLGEINYLIGKIYLKKKETIIGLSFIENSLRQLTMSNEKIKLKAQKYLGKFPDFYVYKIIETAILK